MKLTLLGYNININLSKRTQPLGFIDEPTGILAFVSRVTVRGWAFAQDDSLVKVRLLHQHQVLRDLTPFLPRADLAAKYPDVSHAGTAGFMTIIEKSELPDQSEFTISVDVYVPGFPDRKTSLPELNLKWLPQPARPHSRGDYRTVWNEVADSYENARCAVCGTADVSEYDYSGKVSATNIATNTVMRPTDRVLEIGCGTGRIGRHLARQCGNWVGADVSVQMIDFARQDLKDTPNVSFELLNGYNLQNFAANSFDVVCCSAVFMHLDEWERFQYVKDMHRLLKPGGRCYYDNFNLLGEDGWNYFLKTMEYDPLERPRNISKSSTPAELQQYAQKAGFTNIVVQAHTMWTTVIAYKSDLRDTIVNP